jgi:hypothetical protein
MLILRTAAAGANPAIAQRRVWIPEKRMIGAPNKRIKEHGDLVCIGD